MDHLTVFDFMVSAMNIPQIEQKPVKLEGNHTCALSGKRISSGYETWDIIPSASGEFLDFMPMGNLPYIGEVAATALSGAWNLGSRLFVKKGDEYIHYHPLIARAEELKRPCWSDLVRKCVDEYWGMECVAIVASDPKKRVFHKARVTTIGESSSVYVHDSERNISQVVKISFKRLVEVLEVVETAYSIHFPSLYPQWGFSKIGILSNLLKEFSKASDYGIRKTIDLENTLNKLRVLPEFAIAIIIAQKNGNAPQKSETKTKGVLKNDHSKAEQIKLF